MGFRNFSLKWLLGCVALIGLWAGAFVSANDWWLAAVTVLNVVALLYATLRFVFAGRSVPFWIGVALVGWTWIVTPVAKPIPIYKGKDLVVRAMVGLNVVPPGTPLGTPVPIIPTDPRYLRLVAVYPIADALMLFVVMMLGGLGSVMVAARTADPGGA